MTPELNRRNLSGFQIGNDIFVGLGTERSGSATELKKDFYRLNQEQNTWETIEDIPSPVRETSPSFVLNGKGYICLGINADQSMLNRYTYAYDPLTGSWSQRG